MTKTVKEILEEAAELIDQHGKATAKFYGPDTKCFCAIGAIAEAAGNYATNFSVNFAVGKDPAIAKSVSALIKYLNLSDVSDVYYWNDNPSNSAPDIADAMRKAARAL